MPEPSVTISYASFKEFDQKLKKLSHEIDALDILVRDFKRLSKSAAEIDTMTLSLRQKYEEIMKFTNKIKIKD